jgi:diguanylate cyclase (GGDEF)-like protein
MGTRARLNLYLALTFALVFCVSSAALYRSMMDGAVETVRRESLLRMEAAMAMRTYTIKEVRPLLESAGMKYELPAIPAHAAIKAMALLHEQQPMFDYREVALNPLNPANQPAGWQRALIEKFRADPSKTELVEQAHDEHLGLVLHFAQPVRPTVDCIVCHGTLSEVSPEAVRRYGPPREGWRIGETEGAQIVSVPMGPALAQARAAWLRHVGVSVLVFGALFFVLNGMLSRSVIAPIESRSSAWRELAHKDALTGAWNRRSFEQHAAALLAACGTDGSPLSLVMMDIDHFKRINDQHGHPAGDDALRRFADCLLQATKRRDWLYRLGGEEFALLLPHTDLDAARALAEVLRHTLETASFGAAGRLTASFGVASLQAGDTLETLQARADAALYAAKQGGRNRVV